MRKPTPSEAGLALSELGASKGGKASAAKLTSEQRRDRGAKGGRASAASLSPEERSARASMAAMARWERIDVMGSIGFYTLSDARCRRVATESPRLSRCEILLGARCNFRCPYCRHVGGPDASFASVRSTVRHWINDGLSAVRFSGGEPTLWEGLPEIVEWAAKSIQHVAISTNGSAPWTVYERLLSAGANDFSVSLDACCAADGRVMAGIDGAWETVVENIRRLAANTYVTIGTVLTEKNEAHTVEIIRFAESLGVADIRPIPAAQQGNRIIAGDLPTSKPFPILRWRWDRLRRGLPVRGIGAADTGKCFLALDDMAVMGDKHYPCTIHMREGGNAIGNVGPSMREERRTWFEQHDSHEDPICSRDCLDFCVAHNNRCSEFKGHTRVLAVKP
jgi:sulfatase maturation enzyme AslB (radical SAM superfamily)